MKALKSRAALLAGALAFSLAAFAADPTLHEVYQAADAGRIKEAESMMVQVLRDHPNSAKAHFVEAELHAREGRLEAAQGELGTAERLAPGLGFAKPEAVEALKQRLDRGARVAPVGSFAAHAQAPASTSLPWGPILVGLGLLAALAFFIRSLGRSRPVAGNAPDRVPVAGPAGYGGQGGYGGGYGQPVGAGGVGPVGPSAGGMGSGMLGGLATGAAVGAGIVAGEALMHRVFDGGARAAPHEAQVFQPLDYPLEPGAQYAMGGEDFGIRDAGGWDDGAPVAGDDWN